MSISSPGIGSSLNVNSIVSQLMTVESEPLRQLALKESKLQATLSAVGSMKGALSTIQGALTALKDASRYSALKATSSDVSTATVSAGSGAVPGTYNINVTSLAAAHKLASKAFTTTTDPVGKGTLTIQFGTASGGTFTANSEHAALSVTIDDTNNSLAGVRDAINKANAGVSATIVNDGAGYKLALTSKYTGAANSLKITVAESQAPIDNTDDVGLSQLSYDPNGAKRMTQTQAAKDAAFTIDGIAVTKSSNTITDAIEGVTLTLAKESTATLTVTRDSSNIKSSVEAFVKAFNDASKTLKDLGSYDAATKKAGTLNGDATLRSIQSQLRSIVTGALKQAGGGLATLSDIGIGFDSTGILKLNSTKLQSVIDDPTKDISTLFAAVGKPSDAQVSFVTSSSKTLPGNYAVAVTALGTRGTITGSALLNGDITAGANDTVSLTVDGVSASIKLTAGHYSAASLAAEIQSKFNGLSALKDGGLAIAVSATGTAGKTAGAAAAATTIDATNDKIDVTINGVTRTATLTQKIYASADELATEVQAKINTAFSADGLAVSVANASGTFTISAANTFGATSTISFANNGAGSGADSLLGVGRTNTAGSSGTISISSNRYGSASKLAGLAIDASLLTPASIDTTNAIGVDAAGTIGGVAATGSGQTLTGTGSATDLMIRITGGSTGSRGAVAYDRGLAVLLDDYITQTLGSTGTLAARTDGINASIKSIEARSQAFQQRLAKIEERYRKQFTSLDTLIANMNKTSAFLQQQLANLPKAGQ